MRFHRFATTLTIASILCASSATTRADDNASEVTFVIQRDGARSLSQPVALRFEAFGHRFDLSLEANRALVADGVQPRIVGENGSVAAPRTTMWTGHADDGSDARLTIVGDEARGYVRTPSGTFVFEPSDAAGSHLVRRAEDVLAGETPVNCGAGDEAPIAPLSDLPATARGAVAVQRVVDVSLVADAAFYQRFGEGSVDHMLSLMNQVDGVYRSDLGIALRIVQLVVYKSAAAQPFAASTVASEQLAALSAARQSDPLLTLGAGAVTHLMTGHGLGGPNGIAWPGGVCDAYYATSVAMITGDSDYLGTILIAHEIGHSLGAWHDGVAGQGCETTPRGFIMWPSLGADLTDSFSSCTRTRITQRVAVAACVGDEPAPDCGNGVVDQEEECDPSSAAGASCCRADCTFALDGLPCGDGGDACMESRCVEGACVSDDEPRGFNDVRAVFRVSGAGMVDSAKIIVAAPLVGDNADPSRDGLEFVTTLGGAGAWDQFVSPGQWIRKSSGKYLYKNLSAAPGSVRIAKVRLDPSKGLASYRFLLAPPMAAMSPGSPSIFVLAGNRADGECAMDESLNCVRTSRSYVCK